MAALSSWYSLAFIRCAWESAPEGASTFREYILAALKGKISDTSSGRLITGTSSNGTSVSFALPADGTVTQQGIAELCEQILTHYDDCTAAGVTDEAVIYQTIRARFMDNTVTSYRPDFSWLRY